MNSRHYWVSETARTLRRWLVPSPRAQRLSVYFSCVSLTLCLILSRALYAAAREDAFSVGHELLGLKDLTGGAESVRLNGERFHHAARVSAEPLDAVLNRITEHCRKNAGPAALVLEQLAESDPHFEQHAPPGALRNAVFREQSETAGMVLCFVNGPRPSSVRSWLTLLRRFSVSRDLSLFGRLRYSFAEQDEQGRTRVVTLWADSGLNLTTLFPATGDAAGSDSSELPRPPAARRMLSASADGMPFSIRNYVSTEPPAAVQRFYDEWLSQHGFQTAHESTFSSYLRPDGFQVFLSLLLSDNHTYVTVTETGRADTQTTLELGGEP